VKRGDGDNCPIEKVKNILLIAKSQHWHPIAARAEKGKEQHPNSPSRRNQVRGLTQMALLKRRLGSRGGPSYLFTDGVRASEFGGATRDPLGCMTAPQGSSRTIPGCEPELGGQLKKRTKPGQTRLSVGSKTWHRRNLHLEKHLRGLARV